MEDLPRVLQLLLARIWEMRVDRIKKQRNRGDGGGSGHCPRNGGTKCLAARLASRHSCLCGRNIVHISITVAAVAELTEGAGEVRRAAESGRYRITRLLEPASWRTGSPNTRSAAPRGAVLAHGLVGAIHRGVCRQR